MLREQMATVGDMQDVRTALNGVRDDVGKLCEDVERKMQQATSSMMSTQDEMQNRLHDELNIVRRECCTRDWVRAEVDNNNHNNNNTNNNKVRAEVDKLQIEYTPKLSDHSSQLARLGWIFFDVFRG